MRSVRRDEPGSPRPPTPGLLALLVCGALTGCLYVGGQASFGPSLESAPIAAIHPGQTNKAEVLAMLGPPEEFKRPEYAALLRDDEQRLGGEIAAANLAEDVFTYQFDQIDIDGTWLGLFFFAGIDLRSDTLVIFFDEEDRVRNVGFRIDTRRP